MKGQTAKVQIGDATWEITGIILLKDRDQTLQKMRQDYPTETISKLRSEGFELLALIFPDGYVFPAGWSARWLVVAASSRA